MKTLKMLFVLAVGLLPAYALATTCATDADCAPDEVCLAVPCACGAPACDPDGGECPEPEPCTCDSVAECVPADAFGDDVYYADECTVDADCPLGFACEEVDVGCAVTGVDCACPPCMEGQECPPCDCGEVPVEPPDCQDQTFKFCAYKPVQCDNDADCAEGFACQTEEMCSGGGATSCACAAPACDPEGECPEPEPCDCGDPEPAPEPTCEVTGHSCQPKQIECEAAADCPANWDCVGVAVGCACPAMEMYCDPADAENCPEMPACDCATEPAVSYCMPGGWAYDAARDYATGGDGTSAIGDTQSPTAAFMENASKAAAESTAGTDPAKDGACSYATTTTAGAGTLLLALLALLGVAFRRATVIGR